MNQDPTNSLLIQGEKQPKLQPVNWDLENSKFWIWSRSILGKFFVYLRVRIVRNLVLQFFCLTSMFTVMLGPKNLCFECDRKVWAFDKCVLRWLTYIMAFKCGYEFAWIFMLDMILGIGKFWLVKSIIFESFDAVSKWLMYDLTFGARVNEEIVVEMWLIMHETRK